MIFFICVCCTVFINTLKRKVKRSLLLVLSAILVVNIPVLSGCTKQSEKPSSEASEISAKSVITTTTPPSSSAQEPDSTATTSDTAPSEVNMAIEFIDPYIDLAISMIDADRRELSDVTFNYEPKLLYDGLSREEKAMYDEILTNVQELKSFSYTAEQDGYDVMNMAMYASDAVVKDYPEFEIYFTIHEVVEENMTTALESLYFMPWDSEQRPADSVELRKELLHFDDVCTRIVERMPDDYSAYDKYRYLALVISYVTSYDHEGAGGWQNGTAYGSIVGGYSICQGYSRGFMYLCQKANLWCETVDGVGGDNFAHMWNIVKLDSGTYHVDITWSEETGSPGSREWDSYFMLTQDEILVDHEITDGKVATGTAIN